MKAVAKDQEEIFHLSYNLKLIVLNFDFRHQVWCMKSEFDVIKFYE